jgi:hypothetical protein
MLLAPAVLAAALLATAAVGVMAGRPVSELSTASQAAVDAKAVAPGEAPASHPARGWRAVTTIGPDNRSVTGPYDVAPASTATQRPCAPKVKTRRRSQARISNGPGMTQGPKTCSR